MQPAAETERGADEAGDGNNGGGDATAGRTGAACSRTDGAACSRTDGAACSGTDGAACSGTDGAARRGRAALVHVPGKDNPSVAGEGYGTQIRLFGAAVFGYQRALAGIGETASQITHGFAGICEVVNEIDVAAVKQAVGRDVFGFAAFVVAVVGNQLHDADIADVKAVGYQLRGYQAAAGNGDERHVVDVGAVGSDFMCDVGAPFLNIFPAYVMFAHVGGVLVACVFVAYVLRFASLWFMFCVLVAYVLRFVLLWQRRCV